MIVEPQPLLSTGTEPPASLGQRWAARCAVLVVLAAFLAPVILAGFRSLVLLAIGVVGLAIAAAGIWGALSHRGAIRVAGAVVALAALIGVLVAFAIARFWWVLAVSAALWLLAVMVARLAVKADETRMPEYEMAPPKHPYMIMNPRSGGGKVTRFGLAQRAEQLGAQVAMLEGSEHVDVAALARDAVARGADLLGVAGGDGTQALVAGVAAEYDVPLLVIPAGTRNHFAADLGLDRDDPSLSLDGLSDGVELHIDLGCVNGRPFVNNASFGAYAEVVQSPEYRAEKAQTALRELPDLLANQSGPRLAAQAGENRLEAPQAVLVSNNPYGSGDAGGWSRRPRLDLGILGVVGIRVDNALEAADLLRGAASRGVMTATANEVTVSADAPEIPVGVDGEALMLSTPVRCTIRAGALRVRTPRDRPGRVIRPPLDWHRVLRLVRRAGRGAPPQSRPAEVAMPPSARER